MVPTVTIECRPAGGTKTKNGYTAYERAIAARRR